ncbi:MAG: MFS transporter [Candidatus Competibacteraceae bacterium]|nr:MFS transporter [Candidatus Competibacteraceae bacterium]
MIEHSTQARLLGSFHNTALPITQDEQLVGVLHVGANQRFALQQMRDIMFDIGIVFVVALLAAFELLLLVVTLNFSEPLRRVRFVMREAANGNFNHRLAMRTRTQIGHLGRQLDALIERVNQSYTSLTRPASATPLQAQHTRVLNHLQHRFTFAQDGVPKVYRQSVLLGIRAATFLFMFAEEIARPFLPLYVREFTTPIVGVSQHVLISLPLSAFMLGVALTMPFAGPWCERIGYRKAFVSGATLASAGLIGTGIASGFYDLIAWRVCSAIGYAIMFAACQGYVVEKTQADNRAQGVAVFVGGIMVAAICGPAIGGMLADRIGYTWTFFVGAALAACSAWLAYGLMLPGERRQQAQSQRSGIRWTNFRTVINEPRFMVLMVFAAIPAKLLLSGFLFFLVPLLLANLGSNQSEIGRIVMTYGLAGVLLMPVCARLADRFNAHGFMVGSGGVIAGAGMIPIVFFPNSSLVLLGVVLVRCGSGDEHFPPVGAGYPSVSQTDRSARPRFGVGAVSIHRTTRRCCRTVCGGVVRQPVRLRRCDDGNRSTRGADGNRVQRAFLDYGRSSRGRRPGRRRFFSSAGERMMNHRLWPCVVWIVLAAWLPGLWAEELPPKSVGDRYRIFMILWRGETEVEAGFRAYVEENQLPFDLIIRNVAGDRRQIPVMIAEAKRSKPDLVYTWALRSL